MHQIDIGTLLAYNEGRNIIHHLLQGTTPCAPVFSQFCASLPRYRWQPLICRPTRRQATILQGGITFETAPATSTTERLPNGPRQKPINRRIRSATRERSAMRKNRCNLRDAITSAIARGTSIAALPREAQVTSASTVRQTHTTTKRGEVNPLPVCIDATWIRS
jgi:hypothetical protein